MEGRGKRDRERFSLFFFTGGGAAIADTREKFRQFRDPFEEDADVPFPSHVQTTQSPRISCPRYGRSPPGFLPGFSV